MGASGLLPAIVAACAVAAVCFRTMPPQFEVEERDEELIRFLLTSARQLSLALGPAYQLVDGVFGDSTLHRSAPVPMIVARPWPAGSRPLGEE